MEMGKLKRVTELYDELVKFGAGDLYYIESMQTEMSTDQPDETRVGIVFVRSKEFGKFIKEE